MTSFVYAGDKLWAVYPVPTGKQGIYWHVFDYDAATNKITPVNKFVEEITYTTKICNASKSVSFEMNK